MKRVLLFVLILTIFPVSAQSVSVSFTPSVLFPHDVASGVLKISSPTPVRITGITFYSSGVEIVPKSVSNVGYVGYYELPFKIIAESEGIHTVRAVISTTNGSITQEFVVRVIGQMPKIVLDKTLLRLDEVNTVTFRISTPVQISNVVVTPLFKAEPERIFVVNGVGSFRFEPRKPIPLRFEIEFYNGDNHHVVYETVRVGYVKSSGVTINATPEYGTVLRGDVVKVNVQVANLREDEVKSLRLTFSGNVSPKEVEIPTLKGGESKEVTVLWCPVEGRMRIRISYEDDFGYEFNGSEVVVVKVLNESAVQLSGLNVQNNMGKVTVSGDVCNNGRSKVYNVMVFANGRSYYIGTIDPSDFDSFDISVPYSHAITVKVTWSNEIGQTFSIERTLTVPTMVEETKGNSWTPTLIASATLAVVVLLVVLAWRRR